MNKNKRGTRAQVLQCPKSLKISVRPKRSQVTLFIIIALLIVVAVLLFFFWIKPTYIGEESTTLGFENCIAQEIGTDINDIAKTGGFISPEFYYLYKGEKIGYLCYTNEYYKTCTVQHPFLLNLFQDELKKSIRDTVDSCYSSSIDDLKAKGYNVRSGEVSYEVELVPNKVVVKINAPTSVSRDSTESFEKFNVNYRSPIYDILMIATSLVQYEARYGDSDTSSLMILYPDYIIDKMKRDDGTTIYSIEDKITKTKFQFASRSLAWPAGYTGK